jgi:hypothetical protein
MKESKTWGSFEPIDDYPIPVGNDGRRTPLLVISANYY